MRECFLLARRGLGHVSPNPLVGAVLVRGETVIARGFHRRFGGPHAEVNCLRRAYGRTRGATLYVNLEPCSHHGKTPPCTDAIIRAKVRRVVIALKDPNPLVAGKGIRRLRRAGIRVDVGILRDEAFALNRIFCTHITRRLPYVHVKIAQSLDGFIAGPRGANRWITSVPSRTRVHEWRAEYDAVLVGAGTILADNPRLTTRLVPGRDPAAIVLDGRLSIPLSADIFKTTRTRRVIVCSTSRAIAARASKAEALTRLGVLLLAFDGTPIDLRILLRRLYQLGIASILVEGGEEIFTQFLRGNIVDELSIFLAPSVLGKGVRALKSSRPVWNLFSERRSTFEQVGDDILIKTIVRKD